MVRHPASEMDDFRVAALGCVSSFEQTAQLLTW
jgi:hypothetical protein